MGKREKRSQLVFQEQKKYIYIYNIKLYIYIYIYNIKLYIYIYIYIQYIYNYLQTYIQHKQKTLT